MLCNFAILQKLRQQNYAALRDVLLLASRFQLVEHPLRARATDVLMALGTAMTLSSGH
jgi:hypothetical protein